MISLFTGQASNIDVTYLKTLNLMSGKVVITRNTHTTHPPIHTTQPVFKTCPYSINFYRFSDTQISTFYRVAISCCNNNQLWFIQRKCVTLKCTKLMSCSLGQTLHQSNTRWSGNTFIFSNKIFGNCYNY